MILKYDIVALPSKFREEMSVIDEKFRVIYGKDSIAIEFFDINLIVANQIDEATGEIIGTDMAYKKRHTERQIKIIDGIEREVDVDVWESYVFDKTQVDAIVVNHVPLPLNPNLTESERVDRLELVLLQSEGVI